jgi:hypothetical protein
MADEPGKVNNIDKSLVENSEVPRDGLPDSLTSDSGQLQNLNVEHSEFIDGVKMGEDPITVNQVEKLSVEKAEITREGLPDLLTGDSGKVQNLNATMDKEIKLGEVEKMLDGPGFKYKDDFKEKIAKESAAKDVSANKSPTEGQPKESFKKIKLDLDTETLTPKQDYLYGHGESKTDTPKKEYQFGEKDLEYKLDKGYDQKEKGDDFKYNDPELNVGKKLKDSIDLEIEPEWPRKRFEPDNSYIPEEPPEDEDFIPGPNKLEAAERMKGKKEQKKIESVLDDLRPQPETPLVGPSPDGYNPEGLSPGGFGKETGPPAGKGFKSMWSLIIAGMVILGLLAGWYFYPGDKSEPPQPTAGSTVTQKVPETTATPVAKPPAKEPEKSSSTPAKLKAQPTPSGDVHVKTNTTFTIEYGSR